MAKRSSRDTIGSVQDLHTVDINTIFDSTDCRNLEGFGWRWDKM